LYVVGFEATVVQAVFTLLATVLLLGNLAFVATETGRTGDLPQLRVTDGADHLPWLAQCLGVPEAAMVRMLTWRTTVTRGEQFSTPLTVDKVRISVQVCMWPWAPHGVYVYLCVCVWRTLSVS
jgi:myosin heavy subunit